MSDAPRYPAGWYPDPADPAVLRWWDGLRWTEATRQAYQPPQPPTHHMPQPAPLTPSEPATAPEPASAPEPVPAAAPEPAPAPAPTASEPTVVAPAAYAAPAPPAPTLVAPPLPPAPQYAYPAAPGNVGAGEAAPRRDIPTGTVWIWLVVLLPLVSLAMIFLFDWRGFVDEVIRESMSPGAAGRAQSWALSWSFGSVIITLLGYLIVGAQIVFAYLDWRTLRARGIERPFHWAWIFFALAVSNGVYVIGRGVILRRRTGTGLGPVWAWIAVTVLGWVIGIVFALVLINEVFAVMSRSGYMS